MKTPEISRICASIPKFGPEIKNHCTETQEITQIYASIPDSGPEFQNHCRETPEISRIATVPSLRQQRMARLQHSRGVQAETGCHEGGIILSKKPPEWRLSPPLQRCLCPILIFVAATKNGPPAAVVAATKNGPPAAVVAATKNGLPATVTRLHVPAATTISGKGRRVRRRCGR